MGLLTFDTGSFFLEVEHQLKLSITDHKKKKSTNKWMKKRSGFFSLVSNSRTSYVIKSTSKNIRLSSIRKPEKNRISCYYSIKAEIRNRNLLLLPFEPGIFFHQIGYFLLQFIRVSLQFIWKNITLKSAKLTKTR